MSSIQRERTAQHILGDPGAVIGGEKSLNGREKKNSDEEKSRTRRRTPEDASLNF